MYRPSELIPFLSEQGLYAKKKLSQNFLIDGNIIRKIAQLAGICKDDVVLEIGPGPGALTQELLARGATVVAVEKDTVLAPLLLRLQTKDNRLKVIEGDILDICMEQLCENHAAQSKIKVVSNLPYHLTTPILTSLLPKYDLFSTLTLMMQDEVAKRVVAKSKTSDYGSLSVFCDFWAKRHYGFAVSPHCFYPVPKVTSAIVSLHLERPDFGVDDEEFFCLTRKAFHTRRKMLKVSLREAYPPLQIMSCLENLRISPYARPEELSLEEFIGLFKGLKLCDAFSTSTN